MSRSCPRVASPSPAFSTLITSAPNHASSCVQVGPDCTCVKSRMRTPAKALLIGILSVVVVDSGRDVGRRRGARFEIGQLLAQCALFVEAAGLVANDRDDR